MKFIIAVVILALAVGSQAGLLPAAVDLSHGAWGGPWGAAPWGGAPWGAAHWGAAPWAGAWGAPTWAGHGYAGPSLSTSWGPHAGPLAYGHGHCPTTAYHADPSSHGHDGQYVAANRGSVHVAPLVGHIQSVASTNVQPAPGTTW